MKLRIVCVQEGLGNQMFQYAFMLALRHRFPNDCVFFETGSFRYDRAHHGFELNRVFGIKCRWFSALFEERNLSRMHGLVRGIYEQGIGEYQELPHQTIRPIVFYRGFWQSERYFDSIRSELKQTFMFREESLDQENRLFGAKLRTEQSVAIHIRAGDYYTNNEAFELLGGVCDQSYYRRAVAKIKKELQDARFYLFTNDAIWVQDHLSELEGDLINWNQGESSWKDMYLMSCCRHQVIANSSFSWWGAWLNDYRDKIVIAPKQWFKGVAETDILLNQWIQI